MNEPVQLPFVAGVTDVSLKSPTIANLEYPPAVLRALVRDNGVVFGVVEVLIAVAPAPGIPPIDLRA